MGDHLEDEPGLTGNEKERILQAARDLLTLGVRPVFQFRRLVDAETRLRERLKELPPAPAEAPSDNWLLTTTMRGRPEEWALWQNAEKLLRGDEPAGCDDLVYAPSVADLLCKLRQERAPSHGLGMVVWAEMRRGPEALARALSGSAFQKICRPPVEKLDSVAAAIALQPETRGNSTRPRWVEDREYLKHLYRLALQRLLELADGAFPPNVSHEPDLVRVARAWLTKKLPDVPKSLSPALGRHLSRIRNPMNRGKRNHFLESALWFLEIERAAEGVERPRTPEEARKRARNLRQTYQRSTMKAPETRRLMGALPIDALFKEGV